LPNQSMVLACEGGAGRTEDAPARNGSLTRTMTADTAGDVTSRTAGAHSICRPSAINKANGTKNLIDVLNHNQYRTCAPLLRKKIVSAAMARANTVDCQRWFVSCSIILRSVSCRPSHLSVPARAS